MLYPWPDSIPRGDISHVRCGVLSLRLGELSIVYCSNLGQIAILGEISVVVEGVLSLRLGVLSTVYGSTIGHLDEISVLGHFNEIVPEQYVFKQLNKDISAKDI